MGLLQSIKRDIKAARQRDPAATSDLEVVLTYPGFHARQVHRLAHSLHKRGFRLHAIIDAILGAAGLGDIGEHFPPDDLQWKDASSLDLMARTLAVVREAGFVVASLDSTVIAQRPRLAPHIPAMRQRIATALGLEQSSVNVKATTNDGIGAIGHGEGIAAMAVAVLRQRIERE